VDGIDRGRAPQALALRSGPHRVEAVLPGYAPLAQELQVTRSGRYELTLHRRAANHPATGTEDPGSLRDGLPLDPYRAQ
jgi:hypothetical protein